jgi:hypothetical protein
MWHKAETYKHSWSRVNFFRPDPTWPTEIPTQPVPLAKVKYFTWPDPFSVKLVSSNAIRSKTLAYSLPIGMHHRIMYSTHYYHTADRLQNFYISSDYTSAHINPGRFVEMADWTNFNLFNSGFQVLSRTVTLRTVTLRFFYKWKEVFAVRATHALYTLQIRFTTPQPFSPDSPS